MLLTCTRSNLKLAFDTADKLGVPALMDPEDSMNFYSSNYILIFILVLMDCGPDKFSVVTYVSQYVPINQTLGVIYSQ